MKGLKVLFNDKNYDYFSRILGYQEYKEVIENTNGDVEKLKIFFGIYWEMIIAGNL